MTLFRELELARRIDLDLGMLEQAPEALIGFLGRHAPLYKELKESQRRNRPVGEQFQYFAIYASHSSLRSLEGNAVSVPLNRLTVKLPTISASTIAKLSGPMSSSSSEPRAHRRHNLVVTKDHRAGFQRDRDRILYCSAFKRLAEVTQVVGPSEGHVFHNRLTHTLKVAQVGRRLAQKVIGQQPDLAALHGVDPEVVEAAALAHDLGHPPFGHIAEHELDVLTRQNDSDGYEGNAQSFRIVTKLAVRDPNIAGLDLTRATLNAILKYPWRRAHEGHKNKKFGAYQSEAEDFNFARQGATADRKCVEAELMDVADDIAYCVHDVEDFYRAGFVPLDRLIVDHATVEEFMGSTLKRLIIKGEIAEAQQPYYRGVFTQLMQLLTVLTPSLRRPFEWTTAQRAELRRLCSTLVSRYVEDVALDEDGVRPANSDLLAERRLLKQLVWHYVILNPALASKQHGEKAIIRRVFKALIDAANSDDYTIFPVPSQEELRRIEQNADSVATRRQGQVRVISDLIASMTEQQIVRFDQRLTGTALGSIRQPM